MALGSSYDYQILHDAIIKASNKGILIFASAGNSLHEKDSEVDYPAKYAEVYSVGNLKKNNTSIIEKVDFVIQDKKFISTYLKNLYIEVSGSSVSTALVAGLSALLVEKNKSNKKEAMPKLVYTELQKLLQNFDR
jgi:subtilisin family serine protease